MIQQSYYQVFSEGNEMTLLKRYQHKSTVALFIIALKWK